MIKKRVLKRWMKKHGCVLLRQGGNHEIWTNPALGTRAPVPRHREIPRTLAVTICGQLGIELIR